MRQKRSILGNEDGSALVVGMLVLALASLIGIAAITTSSIEVEATGNEKNYKQNFYRAEGAAMLAAQLLKNEQDKSELYDLPYGKPDPENPAEPADEWFRKNLEGFPDEANVADDYNWDPNLHYSGEALYPRNRFLAIYEGVSGRSEEGMENESRLHTITLYGYSEQDKGRVMIEMGYKMRY
jgi:hypothetical protein